MRDKLIMKWSPPQYRVISLPSKHMLVLECIHTGKHLKISVKHVKKCDPDAMWLIPDSVASPTDNAGVTCVGGCRGCMASC